MKLKNEKGRSMVEMLGVLAVIGVLSIGGLAGYNYAMDQITANKVTDFIQKFYFGLETESHDPDTPLRKVCALYNVETNCKDERYDRVCQYVGEENCQYYNSGAWGMYRLENIPEYLVNGNRYAFWGYHAYSKDTIWLQFRNLKPSVCEKVLRQTAALDRVIEVGSYNSDLGTFDPLDAAGVRKICHTNVVGDPIVRIYFDPYPMKIIDARNED